MLSLDVIPNECTVHTWSDYLKHTPLKSGEMWITFDEELSKDLNNKAGKTILEIVLCDYCDIQHTREKTRVFRN